MCRIFSSFHSWGIANCWICIKMVSSGKSEVHFGSFPQPRTTNSVSSPERWGQGRKVLRGVKTWLWPFPYCGKMHLIEVKWILNIRKYSLSNTFYTCHCRLNCFTFCGEGIEFFYIRAVWAEGRLILWREFWYFLPASFSSSKNSEMVAMWEVGLCLNQHWLNNVFKPFSRIHHVVIAKTISRVNEHFFEGGGFFMLKILH